MGFEVTLQFRYVVYLIILMMNYMDMFTRFGLPMTMVSGLVKRNCSDPLDTGTHCWSEDIKASALGALFYTYVLQIPVTWVASKIGFIIMVRVYLLGSGLLALGMPWFAAWSPYCVITAQSVQGILSCILVSSNFNFVRSWTIPNESALFLATTGSTMIFGIFSGQMLVGFISSAYRWEYFYYLCAGLWILLFILHSTFFTTDVQQSRWLTAREKSLYPKTKSNEDEVKAQISLTKIFQKRYVWSFCVFAFCHCYSFYMVATAFPFYINEILDFDVGQLSYIMLIIGCSMAGTMVIMSNIYPIVDRYIPWLRSRQLFTFAPLFLQFSMFLLLPNVTNPVAALFVLTIIGLSASTFYAGSVCTLNYEMDPVNSRMIVSIFQSCGMLSGFFGPWFREKMTTTDLFDPNYDAVYKSRWSNFFYISSAAPILAITVVYLAMVLRPSEWVLSPLLVSEKSAVVVENKAVVMEDLERRASHQSEEGALDYEAEIDMEVVDCQAMKPVSKRL